MGIEYSNRTQINNKIEKMKIFALTIAAVSAQGDEKKVPPRHPLQRLNRLIEFSEEILTDWYDFLPSQEKWIAKFAKNGGRMKKNFERGNQRCGYYDSKPLHGGPAGHDVTRRDADFDLDADNLRYDALTPLRVPNKLPLVSENGQNDT